MNKIKNKVYLLVVIILLLSTSSVSAADVSLSVQVVERKPTNTINDFDFSTVNQDYSESGRVKGVATTSSINQNNLFCPRVTETWWNRLFDKIKLDNILSL